MPFNYYLFHGTIKQTNLVSVTALTVKLIAVAGMVVIMLKIFYRINPRLKELFGKFSPTVKPDEQGEKEFFTLRAKRKSLCEICLVFAIIVLVASAFLGFSV